MPCRGPQKCHESREIGEGDRDLPSADTRGTIFFSKEIHMRLLQAQEMEKSISTKWGGRGGDETLGGGGPHRQASNMKAGAKSIT